MMLRRVYNVPELFGELQSVIRSDYRYHAQEQVQYYFRGEHTNFENNGADYPPKARPVPRIYRNNGFLEHESDILNEALRTFPAQFKNDKTTFEILTRMQHYGYATRLLDVTQKITTAIAMVLSPDEEGNTHKNEIGFIHVYRVKEDKIKYSTGDTVTALSNLARIKREHVDLEDLSYLAYECQNERAGFVWMPVADRRKDKQRVSEKLDRDIKKVWCVKPVINNPRIDFQSGEFFLFGCGNKKEKLDASFSEEDYNNENSPTDGIARIGVIAVHKEAKEELSNMAQYLDISLARIYPDFHYHSKTINERYKEQK